MQIKQYLNKDERDNFLGFSGLTIYLDKRLEKWGNQLTTDERKRFKTAITNINKAQSSIIERLPKHEAIKIVRASKEHDVRVLTIEGAKALEKRTKQEYEKNLHIKFEEMELVATQILINNCYECKTKCCECILYSMLSRFLIPGLNSERNCPYSYNKKSRFDQVKQPGDEEVYKQALEQHGNKKKSSKRAKKKANRYDDPGEDYEYNFTPKEGK